MLYIHNGLRVEETRQMLTTSQIIVAKCVEYFSQLLDIEVCVDDNVKKALKCVFGTIDE